MISNILDAARISNGSQNARSLLHQFIQGRGDLGPLRPWIGKDGNAYITTNAGTPQARNVLTSNANSTLLKQEWTILDTVVIRAALPRLRAVADVRGRGLQLTIPNGMSKSVLQRQAQSSITQATMSMDGLADSMGDRPVYNLTGLPLPITHKDFSYPAREVLISHNGSMPLDLTSAELAARRVAEGIEQTLLGVGGQYGFATTNGGGTIYGFTNFPSRQTYAMSDPTSGSWVPRLTLLDVLAMRKKSQAQFHFGPFVIYASLAWDQYLDDDLSIYKGDLTLRDRLRRIDAIEDVVTADYLNGYDMVLVQMSSDTVRMVVGQDITTVQWETHGGMKLNFKIMAIMVPDVRADFNGNCGIVHGAVAGQTTAPAGELLVGTQND